MDLIRILAKLTIGLTKAFVYNKELAYRSQIPSTSGYVRILTTTLIDQTLTLATAQSFSGSFGGIALGKFDTTVASNLDKTLAILIYRITYIKVSAVVWSAQNYENVYVRATATGNSASAQISGKTVGTHTATASGTKISMNQTVAVDMTVSKVDISSIPTISFGGNTCSISCDTATQGATGSGILESGTYERLVVKQLRVY